MGELLENPIHNCIEKSRFSQLELIELFRCQHNKSGKCLHCIPIEPYDEEYLKNHNPPIKHMSFQAYIRKLQSLTPSDRYRRNYFI